MCLTVPSGSTILNSMSEFTFWTNILLLACRLTLSRSSGCIRCSHWSRSGKPCRGSNPKIRNISSDQYRASRVVPSRAQLPVWASLCDSAKYASRLRRVSSTRFCLLKSRTKATPSLPVSLNSAPPISTGTRPPSLRKNSFSNGWKIPVAFNSVTARSSRSRHSAGVRSVQRTRPETRSSRPYCSIRKKASLAPTIAPSSFQMQIPTMFASTRRRIFPSRSARS